MKIKSLSLSTLSLLLFTFIAESVTGSVFGPWKQNDEPLFSENGGHGMIFKSFDDRLYLVLHSPNDKNERALLIELEDTGDTLVRK